MAIKLLPQQLANQIAAGEVVERPASIVKELLENSIDAKATVINIDIEQGGHKRIQITDNGLGIKKDELALALARHATSKISTLDDLSAIISLGFRGEALASISSISRLTLTSKPSEQSSAWKVYVEGLDMLPVVMPASHNDGTTIEILDIFYNTPARKRFLKSDKTEFMHIDETLRRVALAYPHIAFTLKHNNKLVRQYHKANDDASINKRLASICGQSFSKQAMALSLNHQDLAIKGWIAKQDQVALINYFYVNGRAVRDKVINHALKKAFIDVNKTNLINQEAHFQYVIYLTMDPNQVDVNVHPAKSEVRFHQARLVHDFVYQAMYKTFLKALTPANMNDEVEPTQKAENLSPINRTAAGKTIFNDAPYKPIKHQEKKHQIDKPKMQLREPNTSSSFANALFPKRTSTINLQASAALFSHSNEQITPQIKTEKLNTSALLGRLLTIIDHQYLLLQNEQTTHLSLQMLSLKHAQLALFEQKMNQQNVSHHETLLMPMMLLLSQAEAKLMSQIKKVLLQLHVEIDIEKSKLYLVSVPKMMRSANWQKIIAHLITKLQAEPNLTDVTAVKANILALICEYYMSEINNTIWDEALAIRFLSELEQSEIDLKTADFIMPLDLSKMISKFK